MYLGCMWSYQKPTPNDISKVFKIKLNDARKKLKDLYEICLIDKDNEGRYKSKQWYYLPNTEEYSKLRDMNFNRALEKSNSATGEQKYRTSVTRMMTADQIREVHHKIKSLLNDLNSMPEKGVPPDAKLYQVGIFAGPRGFGNA